MKNNTRFQIEDAIYNKKAIDSTVLSPNLIRMT